MVSLTLWDIPGREDMDIHKSYFRNLDAAIGKFLLEISTAIELHCLVHDTVNSEIFARVLFSRNFTYACGLLI